MSERIISNSEENQVKIIDNKEKEKNSEVLDVPEKQEAKKEIILTTEQEKIKERIIYWLKRGDAVFSCRDRKELPEEIISDSDVQDALKEYFIIQIREFGDTFLKDRIKEIKDNFSPSLEIFSDTRVQNAAQKTIEVLFKSGKELGYTDLDRITMIQEEYHLPQEFLAKEEFKENVIKDLRFLLVRADDEYYFNKALQIKEKFGISDETYKQLCISEVTRSLSLDIYNGDEQNREKQCKERIKSITGFAKRSFLPEEEVSRAAAEAVIENIIKGNLIIANTIRKEMNISAETVSSMDRIINRDKKGNIIKTERTVAIKTERIVGDLKEHRHDRAPYWHPAFLVHRDPTEGEKLENWAEQEDAPNKYNLIELTRLFENKEAENLIPVTFNKIREMIFDRFGEDSALTKSLDLLLFNNFC